MLLERAHSLHAAAEERYEESPGQLGQRPPLPDRERRAARVDASVYRQSAHVLLRDTEKWFPVFPEARQAT